MPTVRLETESIHDWNSFHETCREIFRFPYFYGMNINAWIDCLSYLDEDVAMTRLSLAPGEILHVEVAGTRSFIERLPAIVTALVESSASVNERYVDDGKAPVLSLLFH